MALLLCKSFLLVVNVAIMLGILLEAVMLRQAKHSIRSWSASFYALCFVWLLFRSVFWALTIATSRSWDPALFYILYWTPHPIQFAAFLLLPLFFAQIAHRKSWRSGWKYVKPLYVAFSVGAVTFILIWSVVAAVRDRRLAMLCDPTERMAPGANADHLHSYSQQGQPAPTAVLGMSIDGGRPRNAHLEDHVAGSHSRHTSSNGGFHDRADGDYHDDDNDAYRQRSRYAPDYDDDDAYAFCYEAQFSSTVFRAVSAACFFVLALAIAYFSIAMQRLDHWHYSRSATALRLSPQDLALSNVSLFVIFLCRGLYQAGSAMQLWTMPTVPLHRDEDISPALLFVFLAWDVLPTLLILLTVHTRTTTKTFSTAHHAERVARLKYGTFSGSGEAPKAPPPAPRPAEQHSRSRSDSTLPDYGLFGQLKEGIVPETSVHVATERHSSGGHHRRPSGAEPSRYGEPYGSLTAERASLSSTIDEDFIYDSSLNGEDPMSRFVMQRLAERGGVGGLESSPRQDRRVRKKRRRNRSTNSYAAWGDSDHTYSTSDDGQKRSFAPHSVRYSKPRCLDSLIQGGLACTRGMRCWRRAGRTSRGTFAQ